MQVSHETIYRALNVQPRGSLARELARHLRSRRQKRYARAHSNRGQGLGRIAEMVMISERPPEVCDDRSLNPARDLFRTLNAVLFGTLA